jgi:hypothetical protein
VRAALGLVQRRGQGGADAGPDQATAHAYSSLMNELVR